MLRSILNGGRTTRLEMLGKGCVVVMWFQAPAFCGWLRSIELPAKLETAIVARVPSSDLLPIGLTCGALRDVCIAHVE